MSTETLPYGKVIKTPAEVSERIAEMASEAVLRYRGKKVLFVTLLNGGVPFASKLMEKIVEQDPNFHPDLQYIRISRYDKAQESNDSGSTGKRIRLDADSQEKVASYDAIVLVDDLIDEGGTFLQTYEEIASYGASSVEAIVLGRKKKEDGVDMLMGKVSIAMIGYDNLPDVWLTGMGMDDQGIAPEANRYYAGIAVATSQLPSLSTEAVDARVAAYEELQAAA